MCRRARRDSGLRDELPAEARSLPDILTPSGEPSAENGSIWMRRLLVGGPPQARSGATGTRDSEVIQLGSLRRPSG
jgi:hypothetical protein